MKQNVRKYNKDFEAMIANCRENPDEYNEEEDEEAEEKDKDEASEGGKANKPASSDEQWLLLTLPFFPSPSLLLQMMSNPKHRLPFLQRLHQR